MYTSSFLGRQQSALSSEAEGAKLSLRRRSVVCRSALWQERTRELAIGNRNTLARDPLNLLSDAVEHRSRTGLQTGLGMRRVDRVHSVLCPAVAEWLR
jgi:hypothetical protein